LLIGRLRPKSISHHLTLYLKHLTTGSLHLSCILEAGRYEIASAIGPPQNAKYRTNPFWRPTRTKQSRSYSAHEPALLSAQSLVPLLRSTPRRRSYRYCQRRPAPPTGLPID